MCTSTYTNSRRDSRKMGNKRVSLMWILILLIPTCHSFDCSEMSRAPYPDCECLDTVDQVETYCDIDQYSVEVTIKRSSRHAIINCPDMPDLNKYLLFDHNETEIESLDINCRFDFNMSEVMSKINIGNKLREVTIESGVQPIFDKTSRHHVTKEMFDSLQNITVLRLLKTQADYDDDFLAFMPNLNVLWLNDDFAEGPLGQIFRNLTQLTFLELTRNRITSLPDRVFTPTGSTLTKLFLGTNRITEITNLTFAGLTKLDILDLQNNQIRELASGAFRDLRNLLEINLSSNRLAAIPETLFENNPWLQNINVSGNPLKTLPDKIFIYKQCLEFLHINDCQLKTVSEHIFRGCFTLTQLKLNQNALTKVPGGIFRDLRKLNELDLSDNQLESLPRSVFVSLVDLHVLRLSNNRLTVIDEFVFSKLHNLEILELFGNHIYLINPMAFTAFKISLKYLDMSHNAWNNSHSVQISPLQFLTAVQELNLRYNRLRTLPYVSSQSLKTLDCSHNDIDSITISDFIPFTSTETLVNLTFNRIKEVNFEQAMEAAIVNSDQALMTPSTYLYLQNNPIDCTCKNFDFVRFFRNEMSMIHIFVSISEDQLFCADKPSKLITDMSLAEVDCPMIDQCPNECTCAYKPVYLAVIVNCSYRNLTRYPQLGFLSHEQIFLNLSGNHLTTGPPNVPSYLAVQRLDLSYNHISRIEWIPPRIEELDLKHNVITNLEDGIVRQLDSDDVLEQLYLDENPWECSCESVSMRSFLRENPLKVHLEDVYCANFEQLLVNTHDLCQSSLIPNVFYSVAFVVGLVLICSLFYRYYEVEVKQYLYSKGVCFWFTEEKEPEDGKKYDVFLSYSYLDEEFVIGQLLKGLEDSEHPYKVCVHFRDWTAGEYIANQISRSIEQSKRTVIVLSNNFLNSVWGIREIRSAHSNAIHNENSRVIIVIYGDLDEDKLDDELMSFLSTYTWVEWGEKHFWRKLMYELPHFRRNDPSMEETYIHLERLDDDHE